MKKKTSKTIYKIGIIWIRIAIVISIIQSIIIYSFYKFGFEDGSVGIGFMILITVIQFLFYGFPGFILVIIAITSVNGDMKSLRLTKRSKK